MAALKISGTIRTVEIDDEAYEPAADIDISEVISEYENSSVDGANFAMRKMMKRTPMRDGVVLLTDQDQRTTLQGVASGVADVNISYVNAAGDKITAPGWININDNTTAENRTTVQLFPRRTWTVIVGQDN